MWTPSNKLLIFIIRHHRSYQREDVWNVFIVIHCYLNQSVNEPVFSSVPGNMFKGHITDVSPEQKITTLSVVSMLFSVEPREDCLPDDAKPVDVWTKHLNKHPPSNRTLPCARMTYQRRKSALIRYHGSLTHKGRRRKLALWQHGLHKHTNGLPNGFFLAF